MLQYSLLGQEEGTSVITVFVPGHKPMVATNDHPSWDAIVEGALAGDENVINLFDIAEAAGEKFKRLSDRVTTKSGRLYLDGEEVNNTLADKVVAFMREGLDDFKPLVNFFELVQANPNEHSREQLYRWLDTHNFSLTPEGWIVGYKGVRRNAAGENVSINQGKAIVNGEVVTGSIPNPIGGIIEMPRGEVTHDPSLGCHAGLHVGTWNYAEGFSQGVVLEVHVNPRDVVSVPTDSGDAKMRVCRYLVVSEIDQPYDSSLVDSYYEDDDEDEDWEEWGEYEDEVEDQDCDLLDESEDSVNVGDIFVDLDSRRDGRQVEVVGVGDEKALVKDLDSGKETKISIARLLKPWKYLRT